MTTHLTELDEKKPYGYIYKIDFPNDKVYIGLTTTSLKQRKKEHKSCAKAGIKKHLYNALRKYNMIDTFELIEIDTADTEKELREKEIMYIFEYNSYSKYGYGYNMTYGGEGVNGWVATQEQREKNSEAQKKYFRETSGAREKASEGQKKRYEKSEEIEKARERAIKQYEKPESREKASEAHKKRYEKPGAREKAREGAIKRFKKPGAKQHLLDAQGKNKPFDVYTKDGIFVKTFTYQMDAKEYLQKEYDITSIIRSDAVLKGRLKSSAGFVFKYK